MNYKLQLHKERLRRMLSLITIHEHYEETFDFDPPAVKEHEQRTIMEYSAEFAALNQLAFQQIEQSNARAIGNITIDYAGNATGIPTLDRYTAAETELLTQQTLS